MSELEKKLAEVIGKLADAGQTLAPQALEVASRAVQVDAMVEMIKCLVVLIVFSIPSWFLWKRTKQVLNDPRTDISDGGAVLLIIGCVIAACGFLGVLRGFTSVNWLAIVDPVSALAMKVLK